MKTKLIKKLLYLAVIYPFFSFGMTINNINIDDFILVEFVGINNIESPFNNIRELNNIKELNNDTNSSEKNIIFFLKNKEDKFDKFITLYLFPKKYSNGVILTKIKDTPFININIKNTLQNKKTEEYIYNIEKDIKDFYTLNIEDTNNKLLFKTEEISLFFKKTNEEEIKIKF